MAYPPVGPPLPPATPTLPAIPPMPAGKPSAEAAVNLTISPKEVKEWWARIELDRQRRKKESDRWRRLLRAYLPAYSPSGNYEDINSNIHFRNVHLKMAEVWAQMPPLQLTPLEPVAQGIPDPQTGQPLPADHVIAIKRAVLNKLLGRDHANVDLTILEALFDIFATSGIGATKICYESDVQPVITRVPGPPIAQSQPGSILGLSATNIPGPDVEQTVPVVVNERWRWYRFSTEKLGIPHDWHSTDYDAAPYLFMEFAERFTEATRAKYRLPQDYKPTASRDDLLMDGGERDPGHGSTEILKGVEVWLHAADFDATVVDRDRFRRLVLIDGLKEQAAIYTDSPYQELDAQGRLTPDSMIGNPIHPIVLRVCSDTAWIPADSCFTDPLVRIENTWMMQDTQLRDANIPRFFHSDRVTAAIDKARQAGVGQGVAVEDELMARGTERLLAEIPHLERAQSDGTGRAHLQRAISETLGISPNQAGSYAGTIRSATEVATVQANVSVRLKGEQNILLARVLQGVRKFDALIQRYMDQRGYVEIVGVDGARQMVAYEQAHLIGRYAYEARPDAQLTIDQTAQTKRATDFVNFTAKSPFMNQAELMRIVSDAFGYDPSRVVKQPDPPGPPPIALSLNLAAANLAENLALPEVRAILQAHGIQLQPTASPEVLALAQAQRAQAQVHGGGVEKVDLVDKHHSDETGQQVGAPPLSGSEPAAPMTAGRMVQ